ncbi:MAG: methyltransferase [Desulfurococcaceae archaeon]|jgi:release factor glutamine methyltransferase
MKMPKLEYIGRVYRPSDDTWLLLELLSTENSKKRVCVDLGAGSGVLGLYALINGICEFVVFIDIEEDAVETTRLNALLNKLEHRSLVVLADDVVLREEVAELIVANPPYLPAESTTVVDLAVEGGIEGYETALYFVDYAAHALKRRGALYIVYSSLSKPEVIEKRLESSGFGNCLSKNKRFFYEVITARRCEKLW